MRNHINHISEHKLFISVCDLLPFVMNKLISYSANGIIIRELICKLVLQVCLTAQAYLSNIVGDFWISYFSPLCSLTGFVRKPIRDFIQR